jgi:hypothetical protein
VANAIINAFPERPFSVLSIYPRITVTRPDRRFFHYSLVTSGRLSSYGIGNESDLVTGNLLVEIRAIKRSEREYT